MKLAEWSWFIPSQGMGPTNLRCTPLAVHRILVQNLVLTQTTKGLAVPFIWPRNCSPESRLWIGEVRVVELKSI
jgi:hypothetical protein